MKDREFSRLLKIISDKKSGLIDEDKIAHLSNEERDAMVYHIVRNRGPVLEALITDDFDEEWLHSCGYLYRTTSETTGMRFVHTSEWKIV